MPQAVAFGETTLFLSTQTAGTLKGYWPGDDLLDYSGNGKTLTKTATVNHSSAKFLNGFDADWDDATAGNHLINTSVYQPSTGDFTLATWFKKNGAPTADFTPSALMLGESGGGTSCSMWIKKTSGYMSGIVTNSGSNTAESTTNVCDNAFHFLVFTRIGTTLAVYVDGVSVASGSSSKSVNGAEVHFGFNGLNSGFDDIGQANIDDAFVLSRGLTSQEVADLFSGALSTRTGSGTFLLNFI